jgi:hypothetical protein
MLDKLAASGLSPEDIDATDTVDFTGAISGFKIPYYTPDGRMHPFMHRVRLANPGPEQGKYTQPSASEIAAAKFPPETATYPYLNPHILGGITWATLGAAKRKKLLIVEGELKAVAAGKMLLKAAIGIPGCWGGVRRVNGVFQVHPATRGLLQRDDLIEVVLDGDIRTNPDVNRAGGSLRRALLRLGVKVVFVLLPAPVPGRGPGLDDWLMGVPAADHQRAFEALPRVSGDEFDEDWASAANYYGLAVNAKGIALPTVSNIQIVMEKHERFATRYYFDVMRGNIYLTEGPVPFTEAFIFDDQVWFQRKLGMVIPKSTMLDALRWVAAQPRWQRNTLLESLPVWDRTPRLEQMFVRGWGTVDDEYTQAVGRNWLVSAMARANEAGCKVDTMLVLVGKQGIKKSMSLEAIATSDLYVVTHSQVNDKDFTLALHRGWVIDLAELSSMSHGDSNHIKGVITTAVDHVRPPYGAVIEEKPRRSIMVGTTNDDRFLRDQTGNRRYWPIACGKIDIDWIADNRLQLLAEAQYRYDSGEEWWEMPASTEAVQAARVEIGPWDADLQRILSNTHNFRIISVSGVNYRFQTSEELMEALGLETWKRKSHMYRDLSAAIKRIGGGWEKYFCAQRIVMGGGGSIEGVNGYRLPVTGDSSAKVIELYPTGTPAL